MPTERQIERMRARAEQQLTQTCVIERPNLSEDDEGNELPNSTPTTIGTFVCKLDPMPSRDAKDVESGMRAINVSDWIVTFPALTDVQEQDTITIGTRTFLVRHVRAPRTIEITRRVDCVEIGEAS